MKRLNMNEAKISWKPPTSRQNETLTYIVIYNFDGSDKYHTYRTKKTSFKIKLTPNMSTVAAAVGYSDPSCGYSPQYYPKPFAKLDVAQISGMFQNIPSHVIWNALYICLWAYCLQIPRVGTRYAV